jgi:phosphomevalonate kinase
MKLRCQKTVSAPGKLLFAGGYLVLESPNVGVVIGVDKRFFCTCVLYDDDDDAATGSAKDVIQIRVDSPQFGCQWNYTFDKAQKSLQRAAPSASVNGFVEKTLRISLLALLNDNNNDSQAPSHHNSLARIDITIQGDNDFYCLIPHLAERNEPRTLTAALALPRFLPAAKVNDKIVKTGLGSSACLVTSLVAALWYALQEEDERRAAAADDEIQPIFRLAQICHCHSQGKVGSGFDVAAACYGSHIYERFPKSLLAHLLTLLDDESSASTLEQQGAIRSVLALDWQGGIQAPLPLPSFLQVMLADVAGGSESPSMARTVLSWKNGLASTGQPVPYWDDLVQVNQRISALLQRLSSQQGKEADIEALVSLNREEWKSSETGKLLWDLREAAQESRRHLKAMGEAAGVPIEPDEQTSLVNATLEVPGVVAALVPGAGGYDAIACIYINRPEVRHAVANMWTSWSQASVCPLTVQAGEQGQGVRLEKDGVDASN